MKKFVTKIAKSRISVGVITHARISRFSTNSRCWATDDTSFHVDFKTVKKVPAGQDLTEMVQKNIDSDKIVLFMKGTPQAPECGFSKAVVQTLNFYGYNYSTFNVNSLDGYKDAIKQVSNWPTFPQVFVNGALVGGCDIVIGLHRENELKPMLEKSGAIKK